MSHIAVRSELGRWMPGTSGNPAGRPVGAVGFTSALRRALAQELDGRPVVELLAERLVELGLAGDLRAIMVIADRVEGRPRQAVELARAGGHHGGVGEEGAGPTEDQQADVERLMARLDEFVRGLRPPRSAGPVGQ